MTELTDEQRDEAEKRGVHYRINRCSELIGAVAKTDKQKDQGWFFRGVDAFQIALNPALIKAGITIVQEIKSWEETPVTSRNGKTEFKATLVIGYTITSTADDSSVTETYIGTAVDSRDKHFAQATTDAYKNLARFTFHIPIGLPDDNELNLEPVSADIQGLDVNQVASLKAEFGRILDDGDREKVQDEVKSIFGTAKTMMRSQFDEALSTAQVMAVQWERKQDELATLAEQADGVGPTIDGNQVRQISALIDTSGSKNVVEDMWERFGATFGDIKDLPLGQFDQAVGWIDEQKP